MAVRVDHCSFTVSALESSIAFYRDVLGLRVVSVSDRDPGFSQKVTGIEGAKLRVAYFDAGNCSVELIQYLSPKGTRLDTRTCNVGSAHICFIVDGFEETIEKLRAHGVIFAGETCVVPAGPNRGRQVAYCKDPDSNTIELLSDERVIA